jgi:hypothetical protein
MYFRSNGLYQFPNRCSFFKVFACIILKIQNNSIILNIIHYIKCNIIHLSKIYKEEIIAK